MWEANKNVLILGGPVVGVILFLVLIVWAGRRLRAWGAWG